MAASVGRDTATQKSGEVRVRSARRLCKDAVMGLVAKLHCCEFPYGSS